MTNLAIAAAINFVLLSVLFYFIKRNLRQHQHAEESLQKTKEELELRVAERTVELISINEQLRSELDERQRTQEALRVSQARFAGILDIAEDAIISVDANQKITLFNQGAEKIFGYTAAEAIGQPLDLLLPLRFAQVHRQHVADFAQYSSSARRMGERREIFGRRSDGTEFPAEASISKLDVGGEKVFTVILRDVTARKQATAALARLSHQNELILNSVGEGLCGLDLQGNITFINPAAAKLLGYNKTELLGQSIQLILSVNTADGQHDILTKSPIYESLQKGTVQQVRNKAFRRKNGTIFPVEYVSTPIWEHEAIIGAVVSFKDISDRQQVERMKDEFISVVSHELRTPLTSIHGSLGMLKSGLLDPSSDRGKRLLEIAVDSTERLVRLINDILDIERIESGKVTMAKQACNAADLMTAAADVMHAMAARYRVHLSVSPINVNLWVDPDRIIQVFTNLLSNAIKFSPPGSTVWLSAEFGSRESGAEENSKFKIQNSKFKTNNQLPITNYQLPTTNITFQVKDTGRGIPADKLETIFERFQQVDASDSRHHEGTGLGLAICRSIVQQHEGRIWVESILGEGSSFYFTLPLMTADSLVRAHSCATLPTPSSPLVLVCDDDSVTRTALQNLLEQQNYRVVAVANGEEAVKQATIAPPDAILLDLLMPGMNGWQVMASLKQRVETKDIPIVICSVCPPDDSPTGEGYAGWVTKPLDETALLEFLKQVVVKPQQKIRVLLVEDDPDLAKQMVAWLECQQIEVFHAPTGREAIHLSQEVRPNLLILDLILPDRDGFEVVEWLSQHNYLRDLPLVVYSAKDLEDRDRQRLKLGQTEFLTKGQVTIQEFEQRVMEILKGAIQNHRKDGSNDSQTHISS
jgi:PAS domain S-box-containing protein